MNTSPKRNPPLRTEIETTVAGRRLRAVTCGQGPAIILLHSLLADRTSFDLIVESLADSHKVVLLDLPGFGRSEGIDASLESTADYVATALSQLGLGRPLILLGNGYGAFMAMLLAIRHPGIASRLVLVGCGAAFSPTGRSAFRHMCSAADEKGLSAVADVAMQRLFSTEFQRANPELIIERKEHFLATDILTFRNACNGLASFDAGPQLHLLDIPVLVLTGELDEATPPAMGRELANGLPNGESQLLPGCAHVPQLQNPELFVSAVRRFIG